MNIAGHQSCEGAPSRLRMAVVQGLLGLLVLFTGCASHVDRVVSVRKDFFEGRLERGSHAGSTAARQAQR